MAKKRIPEPKLIRPDDINPHHDWLRPIHAPGHTQVDFEERINFRRLHDYRLARTRAALAGSGLGALLCFDQHNIRYTTSTVIGEWARDKLTRYSLLSGNGDPYIWDFGSAAKHHRLHATWLHDDHCRAGMLGMRGKTGGDIVYIDAKREANFRRYQPRDIRPPRRTDPPKRPREPTTRPFFGARRCHSWHRERSYGGSIPGEPIWPDPSSPAAALAAEPLPRDNFAIRATRATRKRIDAYLPLPR